MSFDQEELLALFQAEVRETLEHLFEGLDALPADWDIQSLFRFSHNIKGAARMAEVGAMEYAAHLLEDLFAAIRDGLELDDAIVTLAREGCLLVEACLAEIEGGLAPDLNPFGEAVASLLKEYGYETSATMKAASVVTEEVPESAEDASKDEGGSAGKEVRGEAETSPQAETTVRLSIAKLDALMGMSSEFLAVVHRAQQQEDQVAKIVSSLSDLQRREPTIRKYEGFQDVVRNINSLRRTMVQDNVRNEQLSEKFQDAIRDSRMVRIDSLRTLLNRIVRDACGIAKVSAALQIIGGDTEVDRAVLDDLRDPLLHLIRNSVAHGIEPSVERQKANKPEKGVVTLRARSQGTWVEILVQDDGRGIALSQIRDKALDLNLVSESEIDQMSDQDIQELVFEPGFSTAEEVSNLAGRGVGLDVVRKNLHQLGGHIIFSTEVGRGSTFAMRVPLTRLTTKGIVFRLGTHLLAAPTNDIQRTLLVDSDDVETVDGQDVLSNTETPIPVVRLEQSLRIKSDAAGQRPAIVLTNGQRARAFLVDEVIGEKEFVIQGLSWNLRNVPGVMGSAVIDGANVVLIVNTDELLGTGQSFSMGGHRRIATETERRKRILVADDSVTSRTLVTNILSAAGFEVIATVDGAKAWAALNEGEYDLVVTDVEMPNMDGIELTKTIRAQPKYEALPIIIVTSLGNDQHKQRGAEAGANAYIVKGAFDQDQLLRSVAQLI